MGSLKLDTKEKPRRLLEENAVSHSQIDDQWMTVKEVVVYLKASERQIRDMVYQRRIPYSKLGRLLRFHRPTIDKWMLSNSQ